MVGDSARLCCILLEILNLDGHLNCITGSRVTVISLNEWILVELQRWRVCYQRGLPRLVWSPIGRKMAVLVHKIYFKKVLINRKKSKTEKYESIFFK